MKQLLAVLMLVLMPSIGNADEGHIVVVWDNSGFMQDHLNTSSDENDRSRPGVVQAQLMLLDYLKDNRDRSDFLTIVPVNLPQVVWQGSPRRVKDRSNQTLGDLMRKPFAGCSNFVDVMEVVDRAVAKEKRPLTEIIFLSSLFHTPGSTRGGDCEADPSDLSPEFPEEVMDRLVELNLNVGTKIQFFWVFDTIQGQVDDYFLSKGVPVTLLGEQATFQELK